MRGHYGNHVPWARPTYAGAEPSGETARSIGGLLASVAVVVLGANTIALHRRIKELESRPAL